MDGKMETKPTDEQIFRALVEELLGTDNISQLVDEEIEEPSEHKGLSNNLSRGNN